ncbi:MAG: DAK2 domain-containing protein [Gemmatimonadetes bacterium]|nr:DAK2 domain-containing protein [Gemmatimonadota bacterium]
MAASSVISSSREAAASGGGVGVVLRAAAEAANEGSETTVPLTARRGRASYLGQRAAGHMDPGARSSYLLLDAAARALGA